MHYSHKLSGYASPNIPNIKFKLLKNGHQWQLNVANSALEHVEYVVLQVFALVT